MKISEPTTTHLNENYWQLLILFLHGLPSLAESQLSRAQRTIMCLVRIDLSVIMFVFTFKICFFVLITSIAHFLRWSTQYPITHRSNFSNSNYRDAAAEDVMLFSNSRTGFNFTDCHMVVRN